MCKSFRELKLLCYLLLSWTRTQCLDVTQIPITRGKKSCLDNVQLRPAASKAQGSTKPEDYGPERLCAHKRPDSARRAAVLDAMCHLHTSSSSPSALSGKRLCPVVSFDGVFCVSEPLQSRNLVAHAQLSNNSEAKSHEIAGVFALHRAMAHGN